MTRIKFIRSRRLAAPLNLPYAIALGLGLVFLPTLLRLAVDPVITGTSFVTYYPFILIAALLIGWQGGMAVAVLSALLANYLFMEPRHVLFGKLDDTIGSLFFLLSSGLLVAVVDTLRRAVVDIERGLQREARLNAEMKHLNTELQHRVNNTLSVVQGLATHTFRGAPGGDEAVRTFRGRIQALAEANAVLSSAQWDTCQLPDLAVRALAPFNGHGAVQVAGPTCCLPERACVPLVLALHELGTNAVKYGALSTLSGSVELRWDLRRTDDETGDEVVLDWIEKGGPLVEMPTRRGLGTRLVAPQPGLEQATIDYRPEGIACRIVTSGALAT